MPQMTPGKAQHEMLTEGFTKLRCLIRNREFRKDLVNTRKHFDNDEHLNSVFSLLTKWKLDWFPMEVMRPGYHIPKSVYEFERVIYEALKESVKTSPEGNNQLMWRPAVIATDPHDDYVRWALPEWDGEGIFIVPRDVPAPSTVLDIRVDLSQDLPQNVIEGLVKVEIQKAIKRRKALLRKRGGATKDKRRRFDQVDFYLTVFDRHEGGEPFRQIGTALKKSKSTVQSAYDAALRLIGTSRYLKPAPKRRKIERQILYSDPDKYIKEHRKKCEVCRQADHFSQYCDGFKSWMSDHM